MAGWTLHDVRALDQDEYDELVQWIREQQDSRGEETGINVDDLNAADRASVLTKVVHG